MRQALEILGRLPLFAGLSEESLAAVSGRTVERTVRRGAFLFRKGEACHGLYVVIEGRIKVYRASPDGREQVLHVEGPGATVAELPLFDGGPYPASARAIEDSRMLFLPREAFQWLYQNNPEIADAVIRDLGRRLRRLVRVVEKVSLKDVPARVAATLLEYAEAEDAVRDGDTFRLRRTQEELAAELATTRESVARALSRLRRTGVIAQQGPNVRILSVARLGAAARGEPSG
ncbi:MAG TPA: Crp/Fnr family transcriptional regulator [Longimicrobiales bacterium]